MRKSNATAAFRAFQEASRLSSEEFLARGRMEMIRNRELPEQIRKAIALTAAVKPGDCENEHDYQCLHALLGHYKVLLPEHVPAGS